MSTLRLFAIMVIFGAVSLAWLALGGTLEYRTAKLGEDLSKQVDTLWGPSGLMQLAPCVVGGDDYAKPERYDDPLAGDVKVDFVHHNRYKGLLWFSTYTVRFTGSYLVKVPAEGQTGGLFIFRLPVEVEKISFTLDDQPVGSAYSQRFHNTLLVKLPDDGKEHAVGVSYEARGRDYWGYTPKWNDNDRLGGLKKFTLTATTNFTDIDYRDGSVSPVKPAQPHNGGMQAVWQYDTNRTEKWIGIEMPSRPNAGPIAARMSFFAPVSLLFFFTVLFTVVVLKEIPLHPMHYLFISAGFFAFHILLAYLADIINIQASFWICSAVSVFLVISYMRLVAGVKFAIVYVGLAQLVYLVGFSYAFFWPGRTGLTVTIGAIATLFVLMQATGKVKWAEVFRKRSTVAAPPSPPPVRMP